MGKRSTATDSPPPTLFPLPNASQKPSGLEALKGERIREKRDVEYVELGCRTVLNHCNTARMPDIWTINPYRGCEFDCGYCYARYTHEYLGFEGPEAFSRTIFVKAKAPEVLASTLKPQALYKRPIALGTATDPYQPAEKRYRVTRGILEVLARYPGISLSIVTKSPLITRDIDILTAIDAHADLTILVSLMTLERGVLEVFDPRAPSASERLKTVEALSRAGLDAGIHCAPILPGLTDNTATLEELCRAARDHGARFLGAQVLFLTSTIRARFWPLLAAHFPDHLPLYRRLYASGLDAREGYRRLVIGRVRELRARYGLEGLSRRTEGREQPEPAWPPTAQLAFDLEG